MAKSRTLNEIRQSKEYQRAIQKKVKVTELIHVVSLQLKQ